MTETQTAGEFIHRQNKTAAIAEQYIKGSEISWVSSVTRIFRLTPVGTGMEKLPEGSENIATLK